MITIGQLAAYAEVTTKTIRVYHAKGLLAEPERDSSGYRRYTAQHAVDLIKIRVLAEAGVPLARIRELRATPGADLGQALRDADAGLTARIRELRATQRRLRRLADGEEDLLPPGVGAHVDRLRAYGFSDHWLALQADLWLLLFTTQPSTAAELLADQADALDAPGLRQIFLDYDHARDLDPDDPFLDELADRIGAASHHRYGSREVPGQDDTSALPALIQATINASSPAWQRLDGLIRQRFR